MTDKNIVLLFDEVQTKYSKVEFENDYVKDLHTMIVHSKRDDPLPKIIPIFYTHREEEENVNKWIKDVIKFFAEHKEFLEQPKNKIVICDLLESNRTLTKSVETISNYIKSQIFVVSPNYNLESKNKIQDCANV